MTRIADRRTSTEIAPALVERMPIALRSRRALAWTLRLIDLLAITVIYHLAFWLRIGEFSTNLLHSQRWLVVAAVLMGSLYLFDAYRIDRHEARWRLPSRIGAAVVGAGVLIGVMVYLVGPELLGQQYNVIGRTVLIPSLLVFALSAIVVRLVARRSVEQLARGVRWLVIEAAAPASLANFESAFARQRSPGHLAILRDFGAASVGAEKLAELDQWLQERWSGIVVIGSELPHLVVERLMRARLSGMRVYDLAEFSEQLWQKIPIHHLNSGWLALSSGFTLLHEPASARIKRLADVLIAATMLIVLLPLLACQWMLVRVTSSGPGLFRQDRVGLNGRVFTCFKFRSMVVGADAGDMYTGAKDARVTTVGRFLRKSRLDELPQLWNVLRGDMSFIGPRAEWTKCVAEYEPVIPYYHLRHLVRPGLTGWAQVNYPYGASVDDAREKLEYDLYYLKNHSLALDLVILLRTVRVVVFGTGAR